MTNKRYVKPESIKQLERDHYEDKKLQYPNIPLHGLAKSRFSDKTTNDLTKAIIARVKLDGGMPNRINSQGQYNAKLGRWTKGMTRKGTPDIDITYKGTSVKCEVKNQRTKDKMSPEQLKFKEDFQKAGGIYILATSFDGFIEQWGAFLENTLK